VTTTYSASSFTEVDNRLVALLRSRGIINVDNQLPKFDISASTGNLGFNTSFTQVSTNPMGDFILTGTSQNQGSFSYVLSFDRTKNNYITKVLGREAQDGSTAIFVEEFYRNMFMDLFNSGKIGGIKLQLV
ncbi:hypothetical protein RZS08_43045, partial [Arthrospira platensis SPKY1]|nr:hypothetical protein [Arthrospira platensis SPKY1]